MSEDLPLGNRRVVAIETGRDGRAAHYLQIVLNHQVELFAGDRSEIVSVDSLCSQQSED